MNEVLLTVSGVIKDGIVDQIAKGERPMADYIQMADNFEADLIDYRKARELSGRWGKMFERLFGINFLLAYVCFQMRHKYRVIFTDGEQVGIPLAIFLKHFGGKETKRVAAHLMIVHILSVRKKQIFFDYLGIQSHIDVFFVYSTWQKTFIEERWGVEPERVVWTPFMVDGDFFSPNAIVEDIRPKLNINYPGLPLICAIGLEFRDYPTLMEAVDGLDVQVVIAAGSPWSKRDDTTDGYRVPDNVLVQRFSQFELRALYAASEFVVMPLYHVDFQAGVTAILEAMAMGKAVVCTSTPGQTDCITHDENGYYVPPEDPQTLRIAINYLANNPDESKRMGQRGRDRIENEMSLKWYVRRFEQYVRRYGWRNESDESLDLLVNEPLVVEGISAENKHIIRE